MVSRLTHEARQPVMKVTQPVLPLDLPLYFPLDFPSLDFPFGSPLDFPLKVTQPASPWTSPAWISP